MIGNFFLIETFSKMNLRPVWMQLGRDLVGQRGRLVCSFPAAEENSLRLICGPGHRGTVERYNHHGRGLVFLNFKSLQMFSFWRTSISDEIIERTCFGI